MKGELGWENEPSRSNSRGAITYQCSVLTRNLKTLLYLFLLLIFFLFFFEVSEAKREKSHADSHAAARPRHDNAVPDFAVTPKAGTKFGIGAPALTFSAPALRVSPRAPSDYLHIGRSCAEERHSDHAHEMLALGESFIMNMETLSDTSKLDDMSGGTRFVGKRKRGSSL